MIYILCVLHIQTFTECVYGNQASFLKKVAAICGYNKPADASAILSEPETVASSTTFPGVVEEVGTERGSVTIQANSVDSKSTSSSSNLYFIRQSFVALYLYLSKYNK